jgi:hypothetical protein
MEQSERFTAQPSGVELAQSRRQIDAHDKGADKLKRPKRTRDRRSKATISGTRSKRRPGAANSAFEIPAIAYRCEREQRDAKVEQMEMIEVTVSIRCEQEVTNPRQQSGRKSSADARQQHQSERGARADKNEGCSFADR